MHISNFRLEDSPEIKFCLRHVYHLYIFNCHYIKIANCCCYLFLSLLHANFIRLFQSEFGSKTVKKSTKNRCHDITPEFGPKILFSLPDFPWISMRIRIQTFTRPFTRQVNHSIQLSVTSCTEFACEIGSFSRLSVRRRTENGQFGSLGIFFCLIFCTYVHILQKIESVEYQFNKTGWLNITGRVFWQASKQTVHFRPKYNVNTSKEQYTLHMPSLVVIFSHSLSPSLSLTTFKK